MKNNKLHLIVIALLFYSCKNDRLVVWKLHESDRPFDAYLEFHFDDSNTGEIKINQPTVKTLAFRIDNENAYFLQDTFSLQIKHSHSIVLENDKFYGSFIEVEYDQNQNLDSLFEINNVMYMLKRLDKKKDSMLIND